MDASDTPAAAPAAEPATAGVISQLRAAVRDLGFPIVVAGFLLYDLTVTRRDERRERTELLTTIAHGVKGLAEATEKQTATLARLAESEAAHAAAAQAFLAARGTR